MIRAIGRGRAPLIAACLAATLAAGCRWFQQPETVAGVRLGETAAEVQKRLGPQAQPIVRAGGRVITMRGQDGGALFIYLDDQDRVKAMRSTTSSFSGTPEGLKVGDSRDKMLKTYGEDFVSQDERATEGYVYHYRRAGQHLAFVFEDFNSKRIQRIFVDQDLAVFQRR